MLFAFKSGPAAVAINVHFKNRGMVNEAVYRGERHCGVWKNPRPFAEWLVGGDERGAPFISGADELEQNRGFCLIFADVGQIVQNQQVVLVELGDGAFER